jgi:hypothetical protein
VPDPSGEEVCWVIERDYVAALAYLRSLIAARKTNFLSLKLAQQGWVLSVVNSRILCCKSPQRSAGRAKAAQQSYYLISKEITGVRRLAAVKAQPGKLANLNLFPTGEVFLKGDKKWLA